jgi:transcriptional regulator with XRE-family HTH domain
MTLGEIIRENRTKHGLSQEKIAEMVKVSRQAVTKWETNKSMPCMENLIMLADIFKISLDEFTGKTGKEAFKLRPVKNAWFLYSKITLIIGSFLLAAAIVLNIMLRIKPAQHDVQTLALVLGINGVVWFLLGGIFIAVYKIQKIKQKRLINEGVCYNAKLNQIVRTHTGIRIGSIIAGYAVCSYYNQDGELFIVKSNAFILEEHQAEYHVLVYINPNNRKDYTVDIYRRAYGYSNHPIKKF